MTANKKIPALRFKEFEGEWEEKKLGEMCSTFKSGNSITGNDIFQIGDFPVYGGNGLRGYTNSYTHDGFYVLIGRQGALCGNINRAIGKTFISEHAIAAQANEVVDTEWLAQKLDLMKLNQYSESSAQPGLAVNKLVKLKIISPSLPEQQKIASFLTAVDDKIQQLTKKKALLEQYKKGVMQQIFNQQIRFKDDDGKDYPDWEEKKLGEVGNIISGLTYSPEDVNEIGILVLRSSNIKERRLVFEDNVFVKVKEFNPVQENDILICVRNGSKNLIGKNTIIKKSNEGLAFGAFMTVYRSNNNNFLFHWFDTKEYKKKVAENLGATINSINGSDLKKFKVPFPGTEEQQKIGNFLTCIDNKINATGRQLEQTQVYKKGLLQQMFL